MKNIIKKIIEKNRKEQLQKKPDYIFYNNLVEKRYKERKSNIQELFQTENNYIRDLEWFHQNIVQEFKNQAGDQETMKLFGNIGEIIQVNKKFLGKLQNRLQIENERCYINYKKIIKKPEYGHENSKLFYDADDQLLEGFDQYFLYCEAYQISKKKEYQKNNLIYQKVLRDVQKQIKDEFQIEVDNYLSKPFQRISKYLVIFQELQKNSFKIFDSKDFTDKMEFFHQDYDNICALFKKFEILNEKNDQSLGKVTRILEIEQKYFTNRKPLYNVQRKLISEHIVLYHFNSNQIPVILTCFTDLLILIEIEKNIKDKQEKKLLGVFSLSLTSQISKIDSKQGYFGKITTKENVLLFQTSSEDEYQSVEQSVKKVIQDYVIKQAEKIQSNILQSNLIRIPSIMSASVVGTEEFYAGQSNNHTAYIIELTVEKFKWKIFIRYSSLRAIQKYILNNDPQANIVSLGKRNFLLIRNNNQIDKIKINIEGFIQSIFTWKKFIDHQAYILQSLGLPINIYALSSSFDQFYKQNQQNELQLITETKQDYQNSLAEILYRINEKFLEKLEIYKTLDHISLQTEQQDGLKPIKVKLPPYVLQRASPRQGDTIELTIKFKTKAIILCEFIAKLIKLEVFEDFRLVIVDSESNTRVIENDEIVLQCLQYSKNTRLFGKMCETKQEYYALYFQKLIFYPYEMEKILYTKSLTRLEMLVSFYTQNFSRLQLNPNICAQTYALLILSFLNVDKFQDKKSFKLDLPLLDFLITKEYRSQLQISVWEEYIFEYLQKFRSQLMSIEEQNKQLIEQKEETEHEDNRLFTKFQNLAKLMLIKLAYQQPLFGSNQFFVSISTLQESNKHLQSLLQNGLPNIYVAINWKTLLFLHPHNKTLLFNIPIQNIKEISVEPAYLTINYNNLGSEDLYKIIFKTYQGYRMSQTIDKYKEINKLFQGVADC